MSTTPVYQSGETPWIRTKVVTRVKEGTLVTTLDPGESIAYEIRNGDPKSDDFGDLVGSGSDTNEVQHWDEQPGIWAAIATKTGGGALDVGRYVIRWTLTIGGGVAVEDDALRIKP